MNPDPEHVLIVGVSTRAAAESAALAGFAVTAIDAFVDLDQHPSVRALSPPGNFSAHAAARTASNIESDAVVYLAGFENHPRAVTSLAAGRGLWGNTPRVLGRVRDPMVVAESFRRQGHAVPAVGKRGVVGVGQRSWLVKPLAAGGGHGVRPWHPGQPLPTRSYLQERVEGTPGSVVFVAAGGRAVTLGVFRQLIGEQVFGADGYRYCGNILQIKGSEDGDGVFIDKACELSTAAAEEFDLIGVNGIDFVDRGGVLYPVEVNPRWCASMELVERAYGLSVFETHRAACTGGSLPEFDLMRARHQPSGAVGKAIVFARADLTVGDTRRWLEEVSDEAVPERKVSSICDIPRPGERIRAGRPVCTVFAAGPDEGACHDALEQRARQVYEGLATWERARRGVRAI